MTHKMMVDARDILYSTFVNYFYRFLFIKKPKYDKKYNISICGIFKNEAPFLKEWIEYHEMIGVEHFWLYNNNSTDNFNQILKPYVQRGLVTLINWPYDQGQMKAYRDFFDKYRQETQWYSFLDIDEFFVPRYETNLLDWLKKSGLDQYPALSIFYRMFGTSGHLNHDYNKLVIEQYSITWDGLCSYGKCLINSDYEIQVFNGGTHHFTLLRTNKMGFNFGMRPLSIYKKVVCLIEVQLDIPTLINMLAYKSIIIGVKLGMPMIRKER